MIVSPPRIVLRGSPLPSHHPLIAEGIAAYLHLFQPTGTKQCSRLLSVGTVDFHQKPTTRHKMTDRGLSQGTIEAKRIGIRYEESHVRLMVKHMALHVGLLTLRDVGRIAHDERIPCILRPLSEHVLPAETDIGLKPTGIVAGHGQCVLTQVPSLNFSLRALQLETYGNASTAGACIQHMGISLPICHSCSPLHEFLRFGPWHKHIGSDSEGASQEVRLAQGILYRDTVKQLLGYIQKARSLIFRNLPNFAAVNVGARQAEHLLHDEEGHGLCFAFPIDGCKRLTQADVCFIHNH